MFRLNGDIIKQLENIYGIKFLPKYKNELKERILFYINSIILNVHQENFLQTLLNIQEEIVIEKNFPILLTEIFFENNKEKLFNSFNPIWYIKKEINKHYSYKEINYITDFFIYQTSLTLKDKFISVHDIFSPLTFHALENIQYSKSLYNIIFKKINTYIFDTLTSFYFIEQEDPLLILNSIKGVLDNEDISSGQHNLLKHVMYRYVLKNIDDNLLNIFYKLYYLDQIKDILKEKIK